MVFELQRIRAVCGCGPLVSLPYWLCQPACYHTHTHRGGIACKAKKKMNERTHNIFKQPRVGTTASRTRAHWKWRSPSWPGWLLEPRQAPTKPPFCWHAEEKHTFIHTHTTSISTVVVLVVPKTPASPAAAAAAAAAESKSNPKQSRIEPRTRSQFTGKKEIVWRNYLNTWVGSFSGVLYHPPAHLTAFGTPCCKLMTLGFLTPDPHLNRKQPTALRRKHPTVGGFGHFLSPWQLYLQDGRERERRGERKGEGRQADGRRQGHASFTLRV